MQRPQHAAIHREGMSPRRMASIGFVGVLHIVVIWALLNGFAQKAVKYLPPVLEAHVVNTQQPQQRVLPPPPSMVKPTEPQVAVPPEIQIQTPPPQTAISAPPQQAVTNPAPLVNASAAGITNTHTTPPYPPMARRMSEQGIVRLKISVTPQGTVSDAQVEQSSGHPDLDQTAMAWVKAHWRYKPAMQNGMAVASVTEAIVKFDLKNAS